MSRALFVAAHPFSGDILALPVADLDRAAAFYCASFGLTEVERREDPPTVIMHRDGVQLGFCVNGLDPEQAGAAIRVTDIRVARAELEARGLTVGNWRVDERDGRKLQVFFVAAPDGLCFNFNQPLDHGARPS